MRIINYYDRINKQFLELEVNDEVAKFLESDRKRLYRQAKQDFEYIAFSLDDYTDNNGEEMLTYGELIADEKVNIEKEIEQKEFAEIIWNVVNKLEEKQAKAIRMLYLYGYRPKAVARDLNMSGSAFTQFKETALKHLHIQLSYDERFSKTIYYETHYKNFADDVVNQVKQELTSSGTISINLNNVFDLMKSVTQLNKITEKIGIEIPKQTLSQLQEMTKPVAEFFKVLKQNGKFIPEQQNNLDIPIRELQNLINK